MALTARHTGTCTKCNGAILPGHAISWPRTKVPAGESRPYYHVDCAVPMQPAVPEPDEAQPEPDGLPMEIDGAPDPLEHALKVMQDALKARSKAPKIDPDMLRKMVEEIVSEQGVIRIEIKQPDGRYKPSPGIKHRHYQELFDLVSSGEHVYMYGPHGSGKSHAAEQVAADLNLKYYLYSGTPQSPKSDIVGYLDATRELARTPFLEAFEHGGLFCWEELDATATSLQTLINIALSSKVMAFPHGLVRQHEDFRFVGCGNTCGLGANPAYPERRPFDQSFGDRFEYLEWGYDEKLEERIALAIHEHAGPWVDWVQQVRKWAKSEYPAFTPSPRGTIRIAKKLARGKKITGRLLDSSLWHGNHDLADKAVKNCPLPEE